MVKTFESFDYIRLIDNVFQIIFERIFRLLLHNILDIRLVNSLVDCNDIELFFKWFIFIEEIYQVLELGLRCKILILPKGDIKDAIKCLLNVSSSRPKTLFLFHKSSPFALLSHRITWLVTLDNYFYPILQLCWALLIILIFILNLNIIFLIIK